MQNSTFVSNVSTTPNSSYQLLRKYLPLEVRLQLEPTKYTKQDESRFQDQFRKLSDDERQEWADNMLNKCYMSYKQKRYEMLKEDLVFIVYIAHQWKRRKCLSVVELPKGRIEDILKKCLLEVQSKETVKEAFLECGIDISDYELMYYREPEEKSSFKSLFSCCL